MFLKIQVHCTYCKFVHTVLPDAENNQSYVDVTMYDCRIILSVSVNPKKKKFYVSVHE